MTAPGGRGADRIVRTTVATPAVPPARQIDINSASTSRTAASLLRREIGARSLKVMTAHATPSVVGVLLAAGAGRRYGKPKVLVDDWLTTAVTALRDGGCDNVILVLGAAQAPAPAGVVTVYATDWHTGLSASVRAGLVHAERVHADYAVLHVVDTPDVGGAVVSRVLDRALASRSGLARAWFGDRPGHPVVISRDHWPGVLAGLSGDQGAGTYLRTAPDVELVECSDLASGRDWDETEG
jgi:molybdenum cofactor cytidylyltransferase